MNKLRYELPENKKVRVIIDTDAACEADDPFAIAHALLSKKMDVKAIFAEHFACSGSTQRSYNEIKTILDAMDLNVPVFMGEEGPLAEQSDSTLSEASSFLIEEASKENQKPLFVLCIGAITNIAKAIKACPSIISQMTVVWIGCQNLDNSTSNIREFNAGNDVEAANIVLSSGTDLWLIPSDVYSTMHIGLAEIERRIYPYGKIGKHLYENMISYNNSEYAGWTPGESWSLGDSPAVGVVLNENCGTFDIQHAPIVNKDTTNTRTESTPMIRVYHSVDSRYILEDFIAKLQICYS